MWRIFDVSFLFLHVYYYYIASLFFLFLKYLQEGKNKLNAIGITKLHLKNTTMMFLSG